MFCLWICSIKQHYFINIQFDIISIFFWLNEEENIVDNMIRFKCRLSAIISACIFGEIQVLRSPPILLTIFEMNVAVTLIGYIKHLNSHF